MAVSPLMKKLLAASPTKNAAVMTKSVFFNKKDVIPTAIPVINLAFSGDLNGGLTSGLTLLAGPSKSYKSLLSLVCVKAYFDKYPDAICILYDSEGGMSPEYLSAQGVDPERVIHIPIEHLEMLKFDIVKQLQEINRGDKVIIVIDSIGNTGSITEIQNALDEKTVVEMQRAKVIKGLFRMITPSLVSKDVPCVTICHTYSTLETYSKQIISGGCLLADTKIQMADGTLKNIQDVIKGDFVRTLEGEKEVLAAWNPDTLDDGNPECIRVEFDDGYSVVCSENHPFLTTRGWVKACELTGNEDIVSLTE